MESAESQSGSIVDLNLRQREGQAVVGVVRLQQLEEGVPGMSQAHRIGRNSRRASTVHAQGIGGVCPPLREWRLAQRERPDGEGCVARHADLDGAGGKAAPGILQEFDDAGLVEAQERFGQFAQLYPAAAQGLDVPVILDEISARRADKTLEIGKFYQKTKKISAACYYYRQTVRRWPDTPASAEARSRLASLGQPLEPEPTAALSQARLPSERGG